MNSWSNSPRHSVVAGSSNRYCWCSISYWIICCKLDIVDNFLKKFYSDIVKLFWKVSIEECKPKTSRLQRNSNNIPSKSISDYFKKVVTTLLLDYLTTEIERRFDHASVSVYSGLVIIQSKMVPLVYKNVNWREKFSLFANFFKDDFRCPKTLEVELDLWETYWLKSKDCLPDNISSTLKRIPFNGFNNINVSLIIFGTSREQHALVNGHSLLWDNWKIIPEVPYFQKD